MFSARSRSTRTNSGSGRYRKRSSTKPRMPVSRSDARRDRRWKWMASSRSIRRAASSLATSCACGSRTQRTMTSKVNSQGMMGNNSHQLFKRAQVRLPGGVNSPVRAFRKVGGEPFFVDQARGALIRDVDGNEYIDYVMSWGPLMLGHAHPSIITAIRDAAGRGTSYGAPTRAEVELAELVTEIVPSMEMLRLVSSGTEACMSAVRVARGATQRDLILKFSGCYHGHADSFLVQAGSGVAKIGRAS